MAPKGRLGSKHSVNTNKRKKSQPLVPPPKLMSRKRARRVTTAFHKLTRQRQAADDDPSAVQEIDMQLQAMGGRKEYQKASQVSTMFHSTSRWVLGHLSRNGWLYGIREADETASNNETASRKAKKKKIRRPTRLLEIGAINTELLDAGDSSKRHDAGSGSSTQPRLAVRAIDLHCMDRRIEKADFLKIPVNDVIVTQRYDVLVCSMVLNCVPTARARGDMVCRLYHFLRPRGLCFVTIPRTCLALSPYMDKAHFVELLTGVGLEILETKESPKIAFFVCKRVDRQDKDGVVEWDDKWNQLHTIRQGKKYNNDFAIVLSKESYDGETLSFPTKK